ncbi:hypothetical protein [Pseudoduganella lutea]|uniref:Uncharacterized protein n=1 Tax=Pseudoduganella lutea TaxID=321985 RepID=A0A4P6L5W2_9BURK|nr:hypothetical protein [Pseudoduganella lutea]QBE66328.1 hypothetical protein EWM63_27915 [Pseudoduganella lutea]
MLNINLYLIFVALVLLSSACSSKKEEGIYGFIEDESVRNTIFPLHDFIDAEAEVVCVLDPYQSEFSKVDLESERFNKYLTNIAHVPKENYWSLMIASEAAIKKVDFSIARKRFFLTQFEIDRGVGEKLMFPQGFTPKKCAVARKATIAKVELKENIYLVFGEVE